jgi:hypothetical protein
MEEAYRSTKEAETSAGLDEVVSMRSVCHNPLGSGYAGLVTYQQNAAQHAQDIFEHMRYSPYLPMVCEHFKNLQLSVAVMVPATPG